MDSTKLSSDHHMLDMKHARVCSYMYTWRCESTHVPAHTHEHAQAHISTTNTTTTTTNNNNDKKNEKNNFKALDISFEYRLLQKLLISHNLI